jgi:DNA-binding NarL/FixJ family response regulator
MAAVEHGAMGLVRADARLELLIAAIRLVMAGGRYYPAETLTSLAAAAPAPTDLA